MWNPNLCNDTIRTKQLNARFSSNFRAIYKQLFTDMEWDAISSAMKDYADYGSEEANVADSIDAKIATIFRLTANN